MREGLHKIAAAEDTIVALSTPWGRSGLGVIRISGLQAEAIANRYLKVPFPLSHRQALVGEWQSADGGLVDEVVVVLYRGPHSYTGEDVVEISAHGNPLVLHQIIHMVQSAGARIAGPGEFTLRAVAHGKMDLIQAEAVRDFIEAQTDAQARTALRQLGGAVSKQVAPVKERLVQVIARLEAGIDFAEDDVAPPEDGEVAVRLCEIRSELARLQESYSYGKLLVAGARIVIAGKPNVGKSSLFNCLVASNRAIVTEVPGTTRDVVSESADVEGIPIRFFDTAGVRETEDRVERIGVARTLETLADADLTLLVVDASQALGEDDRRVKEQIGFLPHLVLANKVDLARQKDPVLEEWQPLRISAKTGEGLGALREAIRDFLGGSRAEGLGDAVLTSARQSELVLRGVDSIQKGESALVARIPHEMVLLDLYEGLSALNELTGEITTEDILGQIFSSFCIGK